jgi:hypothetical protein
VARVTAWLCQVWLALDRDSGEEVILIARKAA